VKTTVKNRRTGTKAQAQIAVRETITAGQRVNYPANALFELIWVTTHNLRHRMRSRVRKAVRSSHRV
jgi:hypothetical protein